MTTKIETTPATRRINLAIFSLDVLTDYAFDRVTDLNALAGYAEARDLPEIETAIREQICRENLLRGMKELKRGLRPSQLVQVNDGEVITWKRFCAGNNNDPELCAELERALPLVGFYSGGGGAQPGFTVKLIGGLKL